MVRLVSGINSVGTDNCGNVGADHDSTVPSPNDPMVANSVADYLLIRCSIVNLNCFLS